MALYDDVLAVTKFYMGPVADQFLTRQITKHLNTTKDGLGKQHLADLANWCYISSKAVMDEAKAKEYSEKIKNLGR